MGDTLPEACPPPDTGRPLKKGGGLDILGDKIRVMD